MYYVIYNTTTESVYEIKLGCAELSTYLL